MKVIILAGGLGTRLSEYTDLIPKPMVKIGNKPMIHHIMQIFTYYGYKDFVVALGYKGEVIKDYFINYKNFNSDIEVDLSLGKISTLKADNLDWKISLVDTGLKSSTGGRIKLLKEKINNKKFFLTYGDGLSNIDINALLEFHNNHGKLITITAVRPTARFGELKIRKGTIESFDEKPQLKEGWINGGFMVIEPGFLDYIEDDNFMLEREPLTKAAKDGQLMAYCHEGFWQCMDNKRDLDLLNSMYKNGQIPWIKDNSINI